MGHSQTLRHKKLLFIFLIDYLIIARFYWPLVTSFSIIESSTRKCFTLKNVWKIIFEKLTQKLINF